MAKRGIRSAFVVVAGRLGACSRVKSVLTTTDIMQTNLNRRSFLKTSGAMVAPTIIPASALGFADKPTAGDRITLGLIGSGGKGRDLMTDFNRTCKEAQFVAVADPDRTQAEKGRAVAESPKSLRKLLRFILLMNRLFIFYASRPRKAPR